MRRIVSSERRLGDLPFPRDAPVAQHDHAVGDLEHFVETVRDVDHRDAAGAQPAQRGKEPAHFVGGQASRRFVEDEDLGLGRKRAGDRHQRLFRAAQILDAGVGIDVGAQRVERARGAAARRVLIDQAKAARKAERHADVFGHRHPVDQAEILMDEGDRQAAQRVSGVDAAKADGAGVERVDAGQNLDQRRLARAVLAEERENFAGVEGHADVRQRLGAAEALEDAAHLQQFAGVRRMRAPVRRTDRADDARANLHRPDPPAKRSALAELTRPRGTRTSSTRPKRFRSPPVASLARGVRLEVRSVLAS